MKIFKKIFCKHEYEYVKKITNGYSCISGDEIYERCKKCGKLKYVGFWEFEGMGYK